MPDPDAGLENDTFKPWSKRKRLIPDRTYSGKVIYKRKVHFFTQKDVDRVMQKFVIDTSDESWAERLIKSAISFLFIAMEKTMMFVDEDVLQFISMKLKEVVGMVFDAMERLGLPTGLIGWNWIQWLAGITGLKITLTKE